jgi:hypothetical protein
MYITKKLQQTSNQAAKKLGRKGGRKRKITDNKLSATKKLLESDILPKDVAKKLGVSLATLYRWIPTGEK